MENSFSSRRILEPLTPEIVGQLTKIYEFKGKEQLYQVQAPEVLGALQKRAVIESTESSNRIEGVVVSPERVREIVGGGAGPQTRPEAEIAGYRDVLGQIHASHQHIPLTPNVILQLHRDMFKYTTAPAGTWKPVDNTIEATLPDGTREIVFQPVSVLATPTAMARLCDDYSQATASRSIDPLLSGSAFVLDFLCIHPFLDGNGRLARLLTTLLLYHGGFTVARYVGIERVVEQTKPSYYASLRASSEKWHEGQHSLLQWWSYFLGIILASFQELDQKLGGGTLPSKSDRVRLAFDLMPTVFSKAELESACPEISGRTVKRVLEELRAESRVEIAKRGKGALWRKI